MDEPAGELLTAPPVPEPAAAVPATGPAAGNADLARSIGWLLAAVGFMIGARPIADNSFLTHLATGHLILARHAVPVVDPYSATAAGQSWTVQSWLVSGVYAVLDEALGLWAIRAFHGVLAAGIVLGLWRLVAPARQLVTRVALVTAAIVIGTSLWSPRPLLVGLAALVLALQVVQGLRPRWWLVPLFWVWVNSHGSFALGLALVGAVTVGAAIDQHRWWPRSEVRACLAAGAGVLLGMVNPLGWRLLWFPVELLRRGGSLRRVAEWRAPDFQSVPEQVYLLLLAVLVLAAARRASWRQLVPALVFYAAGLMAVRNLGLASLVVVAVLAPSLSGIRGGLEDRGSSPLTRVLGGLAAASLAVSAATVALSPALALTSYPVASVDWLAERGLVATDGVRLGHRETVGNYLTWRFGTEARVFMDDRFDFYPADVIEDHNALVLGGDMAPVLERHRFDVVLWAAKSPLARWLARDPDWDVVRTDGDWIVACRRSSPAYSRCSPVSP
ncbi:MAG: hypothetical protein OEY41_14100 [Acidimicrobiia bacterium]|nr:hypothetical protein [Acidimicrobiia bacterium]